MQLQDRPQRKSCIAQLFKKKKKKSLKNESEMCFAQRIGGTSKEKDKNDQEPVKPFSEDKLKRIYMIHRLPKVNKVWQFLLNHM